MPTPYVIENTPTNVSQPLGQYAGPFLRGTDIYAAINDVTVAGLVQQIGAFKSTDGGLTWAVQDQPGEVGFAVADVCRVSNDVLRYAYNPGGVSDTRLIDFDMSTDTFGAPITGGASPISGSGTTPLLVGALSNGHTVIVYEKSVGGNPDVYVQEYDGATWGTPVLVKAHSGSGGTLVQPFLLGIIVDTSDQVHILRQDRYANIGSGFPGSKIIYNRYTSGALAGDTQIGSNYNGFGGNYGRGRYIASSDEIVWPIMGSLGPMFESVIRGTPSSAPVFSLEGINNTDNNPTLPRYAASPDGTKQYYFLFVEDNTPVSHGQARYYTYTGSGTWSATSTLWWDEFTDPPTPPQSMFDEDFSPFSIEVLKNDGTIGVVLGLFQDLPSPFCAIQYYIETPGSTPAISIACPVSPLTATVGVFFTSDAPVVTSGTMPFTFTLVSGPLWMSINSLTGVVSGIPTATGSVTYQIMVTDSLGATATVVAPCPLSVSAGPPACVQVPATGPETLVLYNEPLEQQGT